MEIGVSFKKISPAIFEFTISLPTTHVVDTLHQIFKTEKHMFIIYDIHTALQVFMC